VAGMTLEESGMLKGKKFPVIGLLILALVFAAEGPRLTKAQDNDDKDKPGAYSGMVPLGPLSAADHGVRDFGGQVVGCDGCWHESALRHRMEEGSNLTNIF
jgi:hypothetical protein